MQTVGVSVISVSYQIHRTVRSFRSTYLEERLKTHLGWSPEMTRTQYRKFRKVVRTHAAKPEIAVQLIKQPKFLRAQWLSAYLLRYANRKER